MSHLEWVNLVECTQLWYTHTDTVQSINMMISFCVFKYKTFSFTFSESILFGVHEHLNVTLPNWRKTYKINVINNFRIKKISINIFIQNKVASSQKIVTVSLSPHYYTEYLACSQPLCNWATTSHMWQKEYFLCIAQWQWGVLSFPVKQLYYDIIHYKIMQFTHLECTVPGFLVYFQYEQAEL